MSSLADEVQSFLDQVLPQTGFKALWARRSRDLQTGDWREKRQRFYRSNVDLARALVEADQSGYDTFYGTCSLIDGKSRKQTNAAALRAFRFDCDVGDGPTEFPSLQDAARRVATFFLDLGLTPSFVFSGRGMHAYVVCDSDIPAPEWAVAAKRLAQMLKAASMPVDPKSTTDSARILRAPGTHHRKDETHPVLVRLGRPLAINPTARVLTAFSAAPAPAGLFGAAPPAVRGQGSDLGTMRDDLPPSSADLAADGCAHLAHMRDAKQAPNGSWYLLLGVLAYCEDGDQRAQEWSAAHPDYSPAETAAKLEQWRSRTTGPTLCQALDDARPGVCRLCPRRGTIKTPAELGRPQAAVQTKALVEGLPVLPWPFKWSKTHQLVMAMEDDDGTPLPDFVVCDRPIYMHRLTRAEVTGHIASVFRHQSSKEGWQEFVVTSEILASSISRQVFARHFPQFQDKQWNAFRRFFIASQNQLEEQGYTSMYDQFGFKPAQARATEDITSFVWGDREYMKDGSVRAAALADDIRGMAKVMVPHGELSVWSHWASQLCVADMESHAYALCASFAAPLMPLIGLPGAPLMHLWSADSGRNKSDLLHAMISVWGTPRAFMQTPADTRNARFIHLGKLNNLPAMWDELRQKDKEILEDYLMSLTVGRDKRRGTQSGGMVEAENGWNTLVISTSNWAIRNLIGYATGASDDAPAARVLDIEVAKGCYSVAEAKEIVDKMRSNTGTAGDAWLRLIVPRLTKIQAHMVREMERLMVKLRTKPEHRFILRMHVAVTTAADLLTRSNMLAFSSSRLHGFGERLLDEQMRKRESMRPEPLYQLGEFLLEHITAAVVVHNAYTQGRRPEVAVRLPTSIRGCRIRVEVAPRRVYIDARYMRKWCAEQGIDTRKLVDTLTDQRILLSEKPRTLTAGVEGLTSTQVNSFEIDGRHPLLSEMIANFAANDDQMRVRA